ncbi:MocR-like pyridoxine biosynthesis transcription factor PdxR [Cellulosilyticum sp. I15G10I2]|uniref:MocR-like pyridoxine biosynthesis transcription factor PdxR n=1 Tax=Cellulosilyticum sp. I15G10I2 TaxID=1892843 RepID=UPI00085C3C81|nr:PLP-dependent aminotransferase family protein [Cellulosilyticum sp. I15G10I2]
MKIEPLNFDHTSTEPLYAQLFHHLKELIITNELSFGEKLPPIRTFAKALGVNSVTVINAYKQLEMSGYITSKVGSGFYISKQSTVKAPITATSLPLSSESFIDFSSASPHPSIFPTETFKQYLVEVIDRDKGFAFGYQESNGFLPLREVLTEFLKNTYNLKTSPLCIQIVSGAQQGIDIIAKSLLYAGDTVITENPTYNGALEVFKSRGCRTVPVTLGKEGINLIELEKKIKICKPKIVYVMPKYQNPTTICYSKETLLGLLSLSIKYNFFILEEDSMYELCYGSQNTPSLKALDQDDRVIYLKSFSKLLMPGLRMGFLIIPEKLLEDFTKTKATTDISSSGLMQRALELYFSKGKWHEHIHYMQEIYRGKYEYMLSKLESLKAYGIQFEKPDGGLCFWLRLPPSLSAEILYETCYKAGVLIMPSPIFFSHLDHLKDRYIRLSFAACNIDAIQQGIEILENCIKKLSDSSI